MSVNDVNSTLHIQGRDVPFKGVEGALGFAPFEKWVVSMEGVVDVLIEEVEVRRVETVGGRIVACQALVVAVDEGGVVVRSEVVFRGGGAVCVVALRCSETDYILATEQYRVPLGCTVIELPAGIVDLSGSFRGYVSDALSIILPTTIQLTSQYLIDLLKLVHTTPATLQTLPSSSDETFRVMLFRRSVTRPELDAIRSALETSSTPEHPKINFTLLTLEESLQQSDARLVASCYMLKKVLKSGDLYTVQTAG